MVEGVTVEGVTTTDIGDGIGYKVNQIKINPELWLKLAVCCKSKTTISKKRLWTIL